MQGIHLLTRGNPVQHRRFMGGYNHGTQNAWVFYGARGEKTHTERKKGKSDRTDLVLLHVELRKEGKKSHENKGMGQRVGKKSGEKHTWFAAIRKEKA